VAWVFPSSWRSSSTITATQQRSVPLRLAWYESVSLSQSQSSNATLVHPHRPRYPPPSTPPATPLDLPLDHTPDNHLHKLPLLHRLPLKHLPRPRFLPPLPLPPLLRHLPWPHTQPINPPSLPPLRLANNRPDWHRLPLRSPHSIHPYFPIPILLSFGCIHALGFCEVFRSTCCV